MEQEATLKQLAEERESKKRLQIEFATLKQRYDSLEDEMKKIKDTARYCCIYAFEIYFSTKFCSRTENPTANGADAVGNDPPVPDADNRPAVLTATFIKRLEICRDGDSRVMAYFPQMTMLGVSARQNTALFNSFGIKKVKRLAEEFQQMSQFF